MSIHFAKSHKTLQQMMVSLLIVAMLFSAFPISTLAAGDTATTTDSGVPAADPAGAGTTNATTTDTTTDDGTSAATSSDSGTDTATSSASTTNPLDGVDGTTGTSSASTTDTDTATTSPDGVDGTATSTATSTDDGSAEEGIEGGDGDDGIDGDADESGSEPEPGEPVLILATNELGQSAANEDAEDITGDINQAGNNVAIDTGEATAQGDIYNDANSSVVLSDTEEGIPGDLDFYTFNATGTNEATVRNDGLIFALTGENSAEADNVAEISTGDAYAALNIANVINTNVVNSDGYLYLKNTRLEANQTLDLQDFFFPESTSLLAGADDCTLLSCMAEDIVYNVSQNNQATVVNDAYVEAITGDNYAEGDYVDIVTGDAYAGANIINVVNTNIIDSNYRLFTLNAMGDLDGDLVLPTQELFDAFFGRPNGMSQTEDAEDIHINVTQGNDATVDNDVNANAETGDNNEAVAYDSTVVTGDAEAESNILTKANQSIYGGDSMYLHIRVHGEWSGDVHGLPNGLTWDWTPDGIIIYNVDAEISPSEILPYDVDSYTANISDSNETLIENNISVEAITGENEVSALVGDIETGNAVASANVMNIANTNIIGTNFSFAVVNIFGDFAGDVTFSATDLAVVGSVTSPDDPLTPGSALTYQYTISNNGEITAQNVTLRQTLQNATVNGTNQQLLNIGDLEPGTSKTVTANATVRADLDYGTHTVVATATVDSTEADAAQQDNVAIVKNTFSYEAPTLDPGPDSDPEDDSDDEPASGGNGGSGGGSSGGGGGGGGSKSTTKNIDREQAAVDPDAAPFLIVSKEADVEVGDTIEAGETVAYTITVRNTGGTAYDVTVFDTLKNQIGAAVSEQQWDLGTVLPGEIIDIEYDNEYSTETPSGRYTNVAAIEAYRYETDKAAGKDPLQLPDAEHTIVIDGVALAVGNVGPLLMFPLKNGTVGMLMLWETSTTSESQMFYSPSVLTPVYNPRAPRLGYQFASDRSSQPNTRHVRLLTGLQRGMTYYYRIRSAGVQTNVTSREYQMTIPTVVARLMAPPSTQPANRVAGAATSTPSSTAPTAPAPQYTPPAPTYRPVTSQAPVAAPTPEPAPAPTPTPEPEPEDTNTGFVGGVVKKVFGFFN